MLFVSLFLAGFTLGVFATLKIFSPEKQEELWDPQNLAQLRPSKDLEKKLVTTKSIIKKLSS